jgi:hypothetical protein
MLARDSLQNIKKAFDFITRRLAGSKNIESNDEAVH